MSLAQERKSELIGKFRVHESDTGSADVQIALLTARISGLTQHFTTNKKDHSSRRGLLLMVSRRRKLLSYLKKHDEDKYRGLIKELGIRK